MKKARSGAKKSYELVLVFILCFAVYFICNVNIK